MSDQNPRNDKEAKAGADNKEELHLAFHGRILDHLGLQMYQSPVAAIAELVSNSWDADAENVEITVPTSISRNDNPVFIIKDDGLGMTRQECQTRFLNVGYNRRGKADVTETEKKRPVLGRKGIGKFAGFGVAKVVEVKTTSAKTGETTKFTLDFKDLRGEDDEYISDPIVIPVEEYLEPDPSNIPNHGTEIILKDLQLAAGISPEQFAKSMARRFLLLERAQGFSVQVQEKPISDYMGEAESIDFLFPRDYAHNELPEGITVSADQLWATEEVVPGKKVTWQIVFHKETIKEDDLKGVAVFANGKLAQAPFNFNLSGGIGNQANLEYMSGRLEAAYLDELPIDIISTERQRINWDHPEAKPLEKWGQEKIKSLLSIVGKKKAAAKAEKLADKLSNLGSRLDRLKKHEKKTVERALLTIAKVDRISQERFEQIADSMLTAWEHGKLTDLIESLSESKDLDNESILDLFVEADVITALHVAEAVKTKLEIIQGLRERIQKRDLENAIRDYISQKPWIISPKWETFKVERSLEGLFKDLAATSKIDREPDFRGRVDLILGSGTTLLLLEFMRPGITIDRDHLNRFEGYIDEIRAHIDSNTASQYRSAVGYVVADNLTKSAAINKKIQTMQSQDMYAMDWLTLLTEAEAQWRDFLFALKERSPEDDRLLALTMDETESVRETVESADET